MTNDLIYFATGPILVGVFGVLYAWLVDRDWRSITDDEIHKLWNDNVETYGTVVEFARALERKLEERNT